MDFQSCDVLKFSLNVFLQNLLTQTQVTRLPTKLPGCNPKAYDVYEGKPEELMVPSGH